MDGKELNLKPKQFIENGVEEEYRKTVAHIEEK